MGHQSAREWWDSLPLTVKKFIQKQEGNTKTAILGFKDAEISQFKKKYENYTINAEGKVVFNSSY